MDEKTAEMIQEGEEFRIFFRNKTEFDVDPIFGASRNKLEHIKDELRAYLRTRKAESDTDIVELYKAARICSADIVYLSAKLAMPVGDICAIATDFAPKLSGSQLNIDEDSVADTQEEQIIRYFAGVFNKRRSKYVNPQFW